MRRSWAFLRRCRFLILLLVCFVLLDWGASLLAPRWIEAGYVWMNDYEITRRDHPEQVWDRVFFGNSTVIAAYREDVSVSGYVNLGLDYGAVTDLWAMLDRGEITVGSELVIGLNWLTLYDDFETNPSYAWHRGALEPYLYFQRDDLLALAKVGAKKLLGREAQPVHAGMEKTVYHGSLSAAALAEKVAGYSGYFALTPADCAENFAALDRIADWCAARDVRLRLVWMPWNPDVARPEGVTAIKAAADDWCAARGVATLDLLDAFDTSCFYDLGHLNYEYGAYVFTEEVDPWLQS